MFTIRLIMRRKGLGGYSRGQGDAGWLVVAFL